ncbi:MAG: CpaD family pilus assembly protein [Hyphomicrobiaceae bacterium]
MTDRTVLRSPTFSGARSIVSKVAIVSIAALSIAACRGPLGESHVAGWLRIDHDEMHPIAVSKQPATLSIAVHRGSYELAPAQRARLGRFLSRYRSRDMGNSKLLVSVPSGSANEVEAMEAVSELRLLISEYGFDATTVKVRPYQARRSSQPPIRVSYLRFVAEGPDCGHFPTNLAYQPDNLHYQNFGCADQKNLAAMVANPADLLGPRTMTPRSEERRRTIWKKYAKGQSTAAKRTSAEKAEASSK